MNIEGKIQRQIYRYEHFLCWKCSTECKCKDGVNKCPKCGNLCDAPFYMDEISRVLRGCENAIY